MLAGSRLLSSALRSHAVIRARNAAVLADYGVARSVRRSGALTGWSAPPSGRLGAFVRGLATQAGGAAAAPAESTPSKQPAGAKGDKLVVEVTAANFATVVMQSPVPVVLDCYADWCGPCKQLTPLLTSAVRAAGGKVVLAKLNVDVEQQLAASLGVRSIPAVFAVHQGKLVDQFTGMVPPQQVQTFVSSLAALGAGDAGKGEGGNAGADESESSDPTVLLERAQAALRGEGPEAAARLFNKARSVVLATLEEQKRVQADARAQGRPTPPATMQAMEVQGKLVARATAGLAQSALAGNDLDSARAVVKSMKTELKEQLGLPEVSSVVASVELAALAESARDEDEGVLREAVGASPGALDTRMRLAHALLGRGAVEEAIVEALEVVKRDRTFGDGAGRELLLKMFSALGADHPLTKRGRARLSNVLF